MTKGRMSNLVWLNLSSYFILIMTIPPMNLAKYSNHEMGADGSQRKLSDIFVKMFPNQEVFEISIEKTSTDISSKLYIGGELFSCSGTFEDENEAKEMISNLAIEFLEELSDRKQKLLLNFAGSSLDKVLNRIFEDALKQQNKGDYLIMDQNKTITQDGSLINDLGVISKKATCLSNLNYSALLNAYIQKSPHFFPKFMPQYYTQAGRFGCSLEFSDKRFETAAIFKNKKEAREEIAKLVIENFFPTLLFR